MGAPRSSRRGRKKMALVDVECLCPGDVLLSTAPGLISAMTRMMTCSAYSHASLHLGGGGSIIQSTPNDGVAFATLELVKAESNAHLKVLGTLRGATVLHVYRHKWLCDKQLPQDQRLRQMEYLYEFLGAYWGKDYPLLKRLALSSPFLEFAPKVKTEVLGAIGKFGADRGKIVPGPFCSQLVFEVLAAAGLPPVSADIRSDEVSPQSLIDAAHTNLRRVGSAEFDHPDDSIPNDEELLESRRKILESSKHHEMNLYRRDQVRLLALITEVNEKLLSSR
jgi:hypothetical protein